MHAKLDAIFGLIDELQAVDTTGIEPMAHAQDVTLPLRDDARHRDRPARAATRASRRRSRTGSISCRKSIE